MNYQNIYQKLVTKALQRNKKDMINVERHHILPKSMGGSDRKSNIVYFTPREHYLAHLLLWKIYRNKSMSHAFWMMCHTRDNIKVNSKQYEILRKEHSEFISMANKGKILSEETKQKIRVANLGKKYSKEVCKKISDGQKGRVSPMKGKQHTEESKKKNSESNKGHKRNIGRIVSNETKEKISKSLQGNVPWNKGIEMSVEAKENMSVSQKKRISEFGSWWEGKEHSEDSKLKMSTSHKGKIFSTDTKIKLSQSKKGKLPNNSKSIILDGITYKTIKEAVEETGLTYYKIKKILED